MRVVLACLLALLASRVEAATLYVNNTGSPACSDATAKASNTTGTPWCSIGRAAWGSTNRAAPVSGEAAAAGDVVLVTAGTYATAGTASRLSPAYRPTNQGSVGNPIIFRASGGVVTLTLSSSSGPVIGCDTTNYVTFDGFTINESTAAPASDTGTTVIYNSTGCEVWNLRINGITTAFGDNHTGVRLEYATSARVYNSIIQDIGDSGTYGQNSAGVMLYDSIDSVIENNNFVNCGVAVYVKGAAGVTTQRRTIIRYNKITTMGSFGLRLGPAARYGKTYQNIIQTGGAVGISYGFLDATGEGREPLDETIANNVIYGTLGFNFRVGTATANNLIANNIVSSGGTLNRAIESLDTTAPTAATLFQRNNYFGFTNVATLNVDGAADNHSLAQWQSIRSQDINGVTTDPQFVTPGTDFHLQVGSPALTLGRVVGSIGGVDGATIPAGAYITGTECIGIDVSGSCAVAQTSPLRIRFRGEDALAAFGLIPLVWRRRVAA